MNISARSYDMTGLGYLGVDVVVDRTKGPMILEFNARPGLSIQLANNAGLMQRLEAVDAVTKEARTIESVSSLDSRWPGSLFLVDRCSSVGYRELCFVDR